MKKTSMLKVVCRPETTGFKKEGLISEDDQQDYYWQFFKRCH